MVSFCEPEAQSQSRKDRTRRRERKTAHPRSNLLQSPIQNLGRLGRCLLHLLQSLLALLGFRLGDLKRLLEILEFGESSLDLLDQRVSGSDELDESGSFVLGGLLKVLESSLGSFELLGFESRPDERKAKNQNLVEKEKKETATH